MNDVAFKYVFGANTQKSNLALCHLLTVFLGLDVQNVQIKNSELPVEHLGSKRSQLDIVADINADTKVDIEMQVLNENEDLYARMEYYLSRLAANDELYGQDYQEMHACYLLLFCDFEMYPSEDLYHVFQFRDAKGRLFCARKDRLYIVVCELSKLKDKPLEEMNQMEKYVYYLRYCQKGKENSKMKAVIKHEEGLQIIESRVDELTEHEWESINKAWEEIARHEELQDIRRAKEKGFKKGLEEGLKEGLEKGLQQGIQQGLQQGIQRGVEQGIEQGIEQGALQNQKQMCLRLVSQGKTIQEIAELFEYEPSQIQKVLDMPI